ncbi:putative GDSL-like lipase/acylhydrolase [Rhodococcus ruber]|uniref:Putative GDSL-like lipase/acylhydrolase n=2 Tax=Nocardiaceae TaxID=85025 RepID=A0A098BPK7_9NOCA|nr:putative GDSL-like lipase/acylhydrolase [Rhodococcus ruber]
MLIRMTTVSKPLTEDTDPHVLPPATAAAMLEGAPWKRYAVFGDSLSVGAGDPTPGYDNLGWPARVERVLRMVEPDLRYLNTARIGATTAQALEEQAKRIAAFEPDLLHVNSGANDLLRRNPDWHRIEDGLRTMYTWAAGTGAQLSVLTLGRAFVIPAFPDWTERVARLNDITRKLAREFDAVLADSWDHPLNDRENLLSEDKIHFATTGQAVLATLVLEQLAARVGADRT